MRDKKYPNNSENVGYRRPPKARQFRKGISGNPTGRPKRKANASDAFNKVFSEPVLVRVNNRLRKVPVIEAIFMQLKVQLVSGETKAQRLFFQFAKEFGYSLEAHSGTEQLEGLFAALMAGPVDTSKADTGDDLKDKDAPRIGSLKTRP